MLVQEETIIYNTGFKQVAVSELCEHDQIMFCDYKYGESDGTKFNLFRVIDTQFRNNGTRGRNCTHVIVEKLNSACGRDRQGNTYARFPSSGYEPTEIVFAEGASATVVTHQI